MSFGNGSRETRTPCPLSKTCHTLQDMCFKLRVGSVTLIDSLNVFPMVTSPSWSLVELV